jgi:hypothetical protein
VGFVLVTEMRIDLSAGPLPPALGTLHAYWVRKRGESSVPPRSAFDPTELRANAGRMHLLTIEGPDVFRYRVYGSRVTNPDAADMTGRTTQEYRDRAFGELVTRATSASACASGHRFATTSEPASTTCPMNTSGSHCPSPRTAPM